MSAVPAPTARRIGDILIELGFASEEDLAKANVEQEKTGQPLGQILVELGVITRLELASALAEQWSDQSASIKLLPIPPPATPRSAPEPHHDDDQYAARLQDAVAELAQRVGAGAAPPSDELDVRVTDLAERIEATVARTQRIEATLATLAESFEGVTGGVEEAFGALQAGMAGLALDLARIDTTVAELVAGPTEAPAPDPALTAQLEELGAAVVALADRPVADPAEVEGRLDALAARVENIVTPDEVVALHETLVTFEQRLAVLAEDAGSTAALDEQSRSLAELRATVDDLESRPVGDPELDERLARIETQFADQLAAKPDAGEVQSLVTRLDASVDEHESLATAVAQLGVRLDEMTWRDDSASTRLEELREQVQSLDTTLTDLRQGLAAQEEAGGPQRLEELAQNLAAMRHEISALAQSVTPADRIEQISDRVEDLTAEREARLALGVRLEEIETRLTADVVTPEHLALALAEVSTTPEPVHDPAVQEQLEALAARIEQLAGDRENETALAAKLDDLERRFPAEIVTPDELTSALARTRAELAATTPSVTDLDPRVEELSAGLASLREELAGVRDAPAAGPDEPAVRDEIAALARRIEELPSSAAPHDNAPLLGKIEALEQRLEAPVDSDPRIDELVQDIAALREQLAATAPERSEADPHLLAKLEALEQRVDAPAARGPGAEALVEQLTQDLGAVREQLAKLERTPVTDPVVASELDTLSQRLRYLDDRLTEDVATSGEVTRAVDAIGALAARVDGIAEAVTTGTSNTTGPASEELQRLVDERVEAQVAERIAHLTKDLDERLAAAEAQPRAVGSVTGDTTGLEDLLERNRMTIERLGLHLGEHDRALAELMRSRTLPKKLDELAARVDEIAGGAPAGGATKAAPGTRREIGTFSSAEPSTGEVKALMRRVEDAEVASQADREKLMNRLERMASSIDWRLQRLEAAETAAASSDAD